MWGSYYTICQKVLYSLKLNKFNKLIIVLYALNLLKYSIE